MTSKQRTAYFFAMGVLKANINDKDGVMNQAIYTAYQKMEEANKEEETNE